MVNIEHEGTCLLYLYPIKISLFLSIYHHNYIINLSHTIRYDIKLEVALTHKNKKYNLTKCDH